MDITSIYIKNFRVFGEEGADIKLSPVTLLTGCNSAGKSSLAKAILLLLSYLSKVREKSYNLIETPMDFSNVVKLGTFDSVLNKSAKEHGAQNIVFGFSWPSTTFVGKCQALFTFGKKQSDMLCNGWLSDLTFRIDNEDLLSVKIIDDKYSLDIIDKEKFIEYYHYYMVHQLAGCFHDTLVCENISHENDGSIIDSTDDPILSLQQKITDLEENLIKSSKIRNILWSNDVNNIVWDTVFSSKLRILSVLENRKFPRNDNWGEFLSKVETEKHHRIEASNIDSIIHQYKQQHCPEIVINDKDIFDDDRDNLEKNLLCYVNSSYSNIEEYILNRCYGLLDPSDIPQTQEVDYRNIFNQSNILEWASKIGGCLPDVSGQFLIKLIRDTVNPCYIDKTAYVDASTTDVRRSYALDNPDKFAKLWKQYNDIFISDDPFGPRHSKGEFMRKWLREFDVCDDIVVENINGSLQIKLISQENPDGRMLADYGYGVTQLVALLLNIEIALCNVEHPHLTYAGLHPAASGCDSTKPVLLIIEEPEVHLHPSLQSKLADMFLDASQQGVHFIVETHSEYLIRRTQVLVSEKDYDADTIENSPFRTYYFPKNDLPYDMKYRPSGNFEEAFGSGFFDVAGKSTRELIRKRR